MNDKLIEYFEVPGELHAHINLMLSEDEIKLIEHIEDKVHCADDLKDLINAEFDLDAEIFIKNCYKKAVINKDLINDKICYKSSNTYTRLAYFAQYECDSWKSISEEERVKIDKWYVEKYVVDAIPRLKEVQNGSRTLIENAYFYTLDETINLIDEVNRDFYLVPCNCKSVALKNDKPKGVCILFENGINTEWDRGWGESITKEKAKELVLMANKNGLMHTSETEQAICNCDGDCCYPIRASELMGTKGIWPKRRYDIKWNEDKCIHCGKCAIACNFNAFFKEDKEVFLNEEKCWGCTICSNHCPVGAIALHKLPE